MNNLIKTNHYVLGIYVSLYSPYKIVAETKKQILIIPIRKKPDFNGQINYGGSLLLQMKV